MAGSINSLAKVWTSKMYRFFKGIVLGVWAGKWLFGVGHGAQMYEKYNEIINYGADWGQGWGAKNAIQVWFRLERVSISADSEHRTYEKSSIIAERCIISIGLWVRLVTQSHDYGWAVSHFLDGALWSRFSHNAEKHKNKTTYWLLAHLHCSLEIKHWSNRVSFWYRSAVPFYSVTFCAT